MLPKRGLHRLIERLADAAAEGELSDLGLSEGLALSAIAELIDRLRA